MIVDSERQSTNDLKGREVQLGELPGVGTRMIVAGNTFRIGYVKHGPNGAFRFSADLVKKYEKEDYRCER